MLGVFFQLLDALGEFFFFSFQLVDLITLFFFFLYVQFFIL